MDATRFLRRYIRLGAWVIFSLVISSLARNLEAAIAPNIQSVSPAVASTLGGDKVTLTGAGLYLPQKVYIGGVAAAVLSSGATFIKVATPPHSVGVVDVTVINLDGVAVKLQSSFTFTIALTTSGLADGIPGISMSQTLTAKGGTLPYHWSVVAGSLPSGLILNPSTGVISGKPAANYGTFAFTVEAVDSSLPASFSTSVSLSITIDIGLNPGQIPASFFGISAISPNDWPSVSFGAFGKGGGTTWPYLEPAKGQYNWALLDAYVANAQAHGFSMFWSNHNVPQWAAGDIATCSTPQSVQVCTSSVSNISYWDDFCTALVKRYKGKIMMYELWNEPDTYNFTGSLADMVELTQHFYKIIRANDPGAMIATPSSASAPWLANYFAAGGPTGIDIVAVHGYLEAPVNRPQSLALYKVEPWHPVMLQYNLASKPIWDTEGSWGQNAGAGLDGDARAAYVAQYYFLHWSSGVTAFYWYSWDDSDWGTLWNSSTNVVTDAGAAYAQVEHWMTGATMPQPCAVTGTVYACPLTRSGGYTALAVWDSGRTCTTGAGCGTSTYTAPQSFTQYRSLDGAVVPIQPAQVVLIGAKPILLESRNQGL